EFLNFNGQTGKLTVGRDKEPVGATAPFLAHTQGMAIGHIKLVDGKIVARELGLVRAGYERKAREKLDDPEERSWPRNNKGEHEDPWNPTTYLPLRNMENDDACIFAPIAPTQLAAIKQFVRVVRRTDRQGKEPVIIIKSESFKNNHGGLTYKPV